MSSSSRSSSPLSVLSRSPSPPPDWADFLATDTITVAVPVKRGPGRPRKNVVGDTSSPVVAKSSVPPHAKKGKGCTAAVAKSVTSQRRSRRTTKLKKEEPEPVRVAAPIACGKRKRCSDDLSHDEEEVSTAKRTKGVKEPDLVIADPAQELSTASVVAQKRKRGSNVSTQDNDFGHASKRIKVTSEQNQILARAQRCRKRLTQEELDAEEDIALYKSKSTILQNLDLARAGAEPDLPSYGRIGTSPPPDRGGSLTPEPMPPLLPDLGFVVGSASASPKRLDLSKKGLKWDGDIWNEEHQRWSQQRVHKESGIPYAGGAAKGKHPLMNMK